MKHHAMTQPRIETYRTLLKQDALLSGAAEECLMRLRTPQEQMYAVLWAPALVSYVAWVLSSAIRAGQKRLYFLARDAYPMYVAAKKMAERMRLDLDIRYVRVSRYSLRIPEYHLLREECLERIFLSGIDVSLYQILNRAGLEEAEMQEVCRDIQYKRNLRETLNRKEILDLKEYVKTCCQSGQSDLLEQIYKKSRAAYQNTLGYLRQEGMLDGIPFAVVDSGWTGTIQKSIQILLAQEKPDIVLNGYYFGLYAYPADRTNCSYHAYFFTPKGKIRRKARFSNCLYEVIYSEPAPMVKTYEEKDGKYTPLLSEVPNPNAEELKRNNRVLELFMDALLQRATKHTLLDPDRTGLVQSLYETLMAEPNSWEAACYGKQLFSDDLADEHMRCIANRLSQSEIRDLRILPKLGIMLGISGKVIHESGWIEGTIVNAGEHVAANLRAARRAKYMTHVRQSLKAGQI